MGGCSSTVDESDKAASAASKRIDRENAKDFASNVEKIKILLLGAGESGKSTVFKQMRLLYGQVVNILNYFCCLMLSRNTRMMRKCRIVSSFIKIFWRHWSGCAELLVKCILKTH